MPMTSSHTAAPDLRELRIDAERIAADGSIVQAIDEAVFDAAARRAAPKGEYRLGWEAAWSLLAGCECLWVPDRPPWQVLDEDRLREDAASEPDQREANQRSAPAVERGLFLVPKVIE